MNSVAPKSSQPIALYIGFAVALLWNIISWQFPFFWDNVLNARIADWFYTMDFPGLIVPEHLDAGHPPFFSMYIAGLWTLFGKSLLVSHLGMLPFLWGMVWAWWRICQRFLPAPWQSWGMLILLVEPVSLAQSSMVSPGCGPG